MNMLTYRYIQRYPSYIIWYINHIFPICHPRGHCNFKKGTANISRFTF